MKRIKIVGLCLIAVFVLGAMIASAAQAAEYGRCVKVSPAKTGKYTTAECTKENTKHEGGWEWYAGPGPKAGYTSTTGTLRLTGPDESYLECEESTAVGEITGPKTGVVTGRLEECRNGLGSCQNSGTVKKHAPFGVIVTNLLDTKLIGHGETGLGGLEPKEGEVWTEFVSPTGATGFQAEYECDGEGTGQGLLYRLSGSLSARTKPVNKMTTSFEAEVDRVRGESKNIVIEKSNNEGKTWITEHYEIYGGITPYTYTTAEEEMEIKA